MSDNTLDAADVLSCHVASAVLMRIGLPLPGLKWRGKQTGMTRARDTLRDADALIFETITVYRAALNPCEIRSKCMPLEAIIPVYLFKEFYNRIQIPSLKFTSLRTH